MKKIVFLMVLVAGMVANAIAQQFSTLQLVAGDTLVMSTSSDTVSKVISATAGYSSAAFKVKLTELSGTTACKAYLYGGDGTDFILTDSSTAFADQTTNYAWFTKVTTPYSHYKVEVRPMGAATASFQGIVRVSYCFKKHN